MQLSFEALCVLRSFVVEPHRQHWAYRLAHTNNLEKSSMSSILEALSKRQWIAVTGQQESTTHKRLMRKTYGITELGLAEGHAVLSALQMPPHMTTTIANGSLYSSVL